MLPARDRSLSPEEYDAITRLDFWTFVQRVFAELNGQLFADNWHIQLLCAEIDRVRLEPNTRLAIALPPRSLKSIIVSVALPAWLLGHNPGLEIVCASYGQELADEFSSDCKRVMVTSWYGQLFPGTRLVRQAMGHLVTTTGGKRYATSVGGTLTGMGADIIIVDDPMKPEEAYSDTERGKANDWAGHTLFTRINKKADSRIIIIQQRLHEDDMIGHVCANADFHLLSFPAIAEEDEEHEIRTPFGAFTHRRKVGEALHPERESVAVLDELRKQMGTSNFSAQYLQSPTPPGGGIVKIGCFKRYELVHRPHFIRVIQSWDCASKLGPSTDYSACTTWGLTSEKHIYLLDVYRGRLEYPELKRKVREMAVSLGATVVLIEDTVTGIPLIQELRLDRIAQIEPIQPRQDKLARMAIQTPLIERGQVYRLSP
jgi:predicted phage terminase large subunit-like protein